MKINIKREIVPLFKNSPEKLNQSKDYQKNKLIDKIRSYQKDLKNEAKIEKYSLLNLIINEKDIFEKDKIDEIKLKVGILSNKFGS
jgi:hypothetical protein